MAAAIVVVLGLIGWPWIGWAAPPSEPEPDADADTDAVAASPEQVERDATIERLRRRAAGITALLAGELDPEVEVSELLTIDLREPEGGQLQAMLESINQARAAQAAAAKAGSRSRRKPAAVEPVALPDPPPLPGPSASPLVRANAELLRAHWQFWILPASERAAVLAAHQAKLRALVEVSEAAAAAKLRLERLRREGRQLAALLAGELELSVDPAPLLLVDLSATDELASDERLARVLAVDASDLINPADEADPSGRPEPELAAELAAAAVELDAQRLRFAALTLDERRELLARHQARQRQAEDQLAIEELIETDEAVVMDVEEELTEAVDKAAHARREREQAQVAAAQARSEALRRIGEERARLLGVKEDHAVYEVELTQRRRETRAAQEVALEWDRRISELAQLRPGTAREDQADALYSDLRRALVDARTRLRDTLSSIASGDSGVAPVGEPIGGLPIDVDHGDLAALRSELEVSEKALRALEHDIVWAAADGGRDDSVTLNRARLILLDLASNDLRKRMTGFGSDGVRQVQRELEQIVLELRYRVVALPRLVRGLVADLEASPLPLLFGLLQLAFILMVFRYWRRRAPATLENLRDGFVARERGNRRLNNAIALTIWYVERIRRPLEWLALFGVVFRVLLDDGRTLELEVLWLVVLWLNVGYTVILFVDAVAAHESLAYGRGNNFTAQLRIRSLRLVGLTVVLTGLILSLTEETVGRGAIHQWVRSSVWIAAVPILLVLIRWWRDQAFHRIQSDKELPNSLVIRWIRANTAGWASFPAAALAGAYLFGRGLMRWLLRRATSLEITRRLLAWMFRREVARQANAREAEQVALQPIAAAEYPGFNPAVAIASVAELGEATRQVSADLLGEIIELKTTQRGTLSAIIGERGAGKTTCLRRLAAILEDRARTYVHELAVHEQVPAEGGRHEEYGRLTVRQVQCPPGGFRQLQRTIADAIGLPRNASREQLVAGLAEQSPLVFLIDDAHRLVRPAIGGLAGLDQFADFAREVSRDASWVVSIGAAAWQYVSRARGDRVFFDQVLTLPGWNEQQIGALIRDRCAAAGLTPSFADIVIPRQFDVSTVAEGEDQPSEERRAELGYYRILWDYAKGNPGVALHFWRESLWVTADDEPEVRVRLFKEPPSAALDDVGATLRFVLRGVVQLEIASPADLVACTQLPPADVADALRFALSRGWVDRVGSYGDRYRVTWHWYRSITNMLRRQHLLAI